MTGGRVYDRARLKPLLALAKDRKLAVHLDGARIFNAAAALGVEVEELTRGFDSVMFCLSKGLGAPVGSLLCGGKDFIAEAWRIRKMFGGGMRQAGVLAAAGIIALESEVDRLAEDHANGRRLAEGIAALPRCRVDLATVQTNIVIFRVDRPGGATALKAGSEARKVKIHQIGPDAIRCVTHKDVDSEDVARALDAFREITAGW
jgi:threonine aldolase